MHADGAPEIARKRRSRLRWIAAWIGLLAASHGVRALSSAREAPPEPGEARVEVRAFPAGGGADAETVTIAYRESGGASSPAVLLVHGSPGRGSDLAGLARPLERRYRVIRPDLPGFGRSTRRIPDYSIRAHADYLLQLLDAIGVDAVHVVGFSQGGGAALHLADLAPGRVRSVVLLSSIGVQETELLGDYRLNRLLHGLQLASIRVVLEAVPHFGLLDRIPFDAGYARSFYDTDPRPLREVLRRLEPPTLILHGRRDVLAPPAAAHESHRLVPQSELRLIDAGHFAVFTRPADVAGLIAAFIERAASGLAPDRSGADPARAALASAPFDPSRLAEASGSRGTILILILIALATLVSEDLATIGAGLLVAQGRIELLSGILACWAGIWAGDTLLYLAGRWLGRAALRRAPLRWLVGEAAIDRASRWFTERGPVVIALSRFLPGTRLPTYVAAGVLRTSFLSFTGYFLLAAGVWTPLVVGVSTIAGSAALDLAGRAQWLVPAALLVLAAAGTLASRLVLPLFSHLGRRRLVGAWRRLTRWEFWPPVVTYVPVVLYVLVLAVRHRGACLFTAVNPAIPAGGFIAESKAEILRGLRESSGFVARARLLPAGEPRLDLARAFVAIEGFPVVLKPDAGQRGSGVAIVRSENELESYLDRFPFDTLIQEYVPGEEFGIFYRRHPREERGEVFSITEKRMPYVTGDGRRSLERLILDDPRAVSMAPVYLARLASRRDEVPPVGERVFLVEIGTHCRGAVFLDGSRIHTPALESTIDRISRGFPGFFFGRYDVRTASVEDLMEGRNFKIVELNGVTSEATHVYDPRIGVLDAYRILFDQWRSAFEIAAENRRRGVVPTSPARLVRLALEYRRMARLHPGG